MEQYKTKGTCARQINFEIDGDKIKTVEFINGCDGNLKAISRLVEGMDVEKAIETLKGITCGSNSTSCADQFAIALREYKGK